MTIFHLVPNFGYVKVFSKSYPIQKKTILSKRELEILDLTLKGLSGKMIADQLFISMQTVKNHKRNMMDKTSTKNMADLINLSFRNNWL